MLEAYNKIEKPEEIFEASKIKSETKDGLKQKCNLAISSGSAKDYYLTKRWCVKAETIKEMLERNKYTKLDPSSEAPDNKIKWKARTKLIAGVPENKRIIKASLKENDDNNNIALLKEECNKLNIDNSKTHESNYFEQNYLKAKEGCAFRK